jgi:transposase-like protein
MRKFSYAGYRFPPEIIRQAIWLYLRFTLSLRDAEDLLAERGIIVSYETVVHSCWRRQRLGGPCVRRSVAFQLIRSAACVANPF